MRNIINRPRPTPRNNLPLKRPTNPTKQHQQRSTQPKRPPKRPPITAHLKLQPLELNAKIPRHQRHRREQDGYLGKQQSNPGEALDREGFFDGDEVEVHHYEGLFLVEAFGYLGEGVELDAVFEAVSYTHLTLPTT